MRKEKHVITLAQRTAVDTAVFLPDPRTAARRDDRGLELSVNWEDDDGALTFTLGRPGAENGAARLALAQIMATSSESVVPSPLSHERSPQDDNPYHGDIVYRGDLPSILQKQLAAALALRCRYLPPQR